MTYTLNTNMSEPVWSVPIPLVGIDEILGLLFMLSRERVRELTFRGDFPEPAAELAAGDVWHREDVEVWIKQHGDAVAGMLAPRLG